MSASPGRSIARRWNGRLAHYRGHGNGEHLEALLAEALRFTGMHLENDLIHSSYWSTAPLIRRASLLLYLVDQGVVDRSVRSGRASYEAQANSVNWVLGQPALIPYLIPTLELLSAIQADQSRRRRSAQA